MKLEKLKLETSTRGAFWEKYVTLEDGCHSVSRVEGYCVCWKRRVWIVKLIIVWKDCLAGENEANKDSDVTYVL